MVKGICPLFGNETELQESHIFPKFAYIDLKWNNQAKFVTLHKKCPPTQSGYKVSLLGNEAEKFFSKYETWFARHFYRPFRNGEIKGTFNYDEHLYYFLVLQTWRGCAYATREFGKEGFANGLFEKLKSAMDEWKNFLVNETIPIEHNLFYLMPLGNEHIRLPHFLEVDFYLRRAFEFNIMVTEAGYAVYSKLPSMIIWAPLDCQSKIDYGFQIMHEGGSFDLSHYVITDPEIMDYLMHKIEQTIEWRKHVALTNPEKIVKNQKRMAIDKEFQESELAEILSKPSLSEMQLSGADYTMSIIC